MKLLNYLLAGWFCVASNGYATPELDAPPGNLLGKTTEGLEIHLKLDLFPLRISSSQKNESIIAAHIIVQNHSEVELTYPTDTWVKGPIFVFYWINPQGKRIPLVVPLPPGQVRAVGPGLAKLAPGQTQEYDEEISGTFLPVIGAGPVIGEITYFQNIGKEPWKGTAFSAWSNAALLK